MVTDAQVRSLRLSKTEKNQAAHWMGNSDPMKQKSPPSSIKNSLSLDKNRDANLLPWGWAATPKIRACRNPEDPARSGCVCRTSGETLGAIRRFVRTGPFAFAARVRDGSNWASSSTTPAPRSALSSFRLMISPICQ
jgi:hypothetical protein